MWDLKEAMWVDETRHRDFHAAFRGEFATPSSASVRIRLLSSCPTLVFVDGNWIGEGPVRWPRSAPEFQVFKVPVNSGKHVIAIHAHSEGVDTRMMVQQSPFVACDVQIGNDPAHTSWKTIGLPGYSAEVRRINPQLGWIDWCDTRRVPLDWQSISFDDSKWDAPTRIQLNAKPLQTDVVVQFREPMNLQPVRHGLFTEGFGYEADDPPVRFFLRDLEAQHGTPQGVWRRYDLGRVRLGRPLFTLDLPKGAVVETAHSESLAGGRVNPWITLSTGSSCNMDHFVARGRPQEFMPHTVKGGRFLEIHVSCDPKHIHILNERFVERTYHDHPTGTFHSSDRHLAEIWSVGVETYRACSEDTVIDNPTRERGEWIGDSLTVGLENAAVAYGDLRLFRRAISQAAACARSDGLVAGLCPGTVSYLSTYACHWVTANVRMWELTGDKSFLEAMYPAADRNLKAFSSKLGNDGLSGDLGWAFIDWGYMGNDGPSDMGLNMIYLGALRSMIKWSQGLGRSSAEHEENAKRLEGIVQRYLSSEYAKNGAWKSIGLQRAALALRLNLVEADKLSSCLAFITAHYKSCFPNDPTAPNLADPETAQPRLITPFFSHFALAALWEHGEGDFVLNQYRSCWGWALSQGLTTWPEVFDLRWSLCHQWSGCPTWQLSRYILGLWPRQDLGANTFEFISHRNSLHLATGEVPIPETDLTVSVTASRKNNRRIWEFESKTPVRIRFGTEFSEFQGRYEHSEPLT